MTRLLEVPFDEGTILFAVSDTSGGQAFGAEDIVTRAADRLESAIETVRRVAKAFAGKLADLECQSAEVTVGLKLSGKGKFVIAEFSGEASINVKIVLKK